MKRFLMVLIVTPGLLLTAARAQDKKGAAVAPPVTDTAKKKPAAGITDKVKSCRKVEGLFTLYQDTATGTVQLYVKKNQLGKEYIYQSFSISGPNQLYLNQSMHRATLVFKIEKAFDKLEFSRVNNRFMNGPANTESKTASVDKPEAVFLVEKTVAEDANNYLVSADRFFISEKLDPVKPLFPPGLPPTAIF